MSDRKHWKAHEWVIWLLFYSLPIMKELFPGKYVRHWSLLVDGITIFLKTSITASEVYYAQRCLFTFVKDIESLYGIEHVSFNVHLLSHLAQSVLINGPLWTHSAFIYENFHQELKKFVKSSNAANLQILKSFRSKQAFHKIHNLYYSNLTIPQRDYLDKLLNKRKHPAASLVIGNVKLIGKAVVKDLTDDYFLAFQRINIPVQQNSLSSYYKRIIINKEIIVSKDYTRVRKRNSYTVLLTNNAIFEVKIFIVVKEQNEQMCYALGKYFQSVPNTSFPNRKLQHLIFIKRSDRENLYAAVNVTYIKEKVIIVNTQNDGMIVACKHPNRFELLT